MAFLKSIINIYSCFYNNQENMNDLLVVFMVVYSVVDAFNFGYQKLVENVFKL
jgi:Sec7-like guanine-nucleotide exchange factor